MICICLFVFGFFYLCCYPSVWFLWSVLLFLVMTSWQGVLWLLLLAAVCGLQGGPLDPVPLSVKGELELEQMSQNRRQASVVANLEPISLSKFRTKSFKWYIKNSNEFCHIGRDSKIKSRERERISDLHCQKFKSFENGLTSFDTPLGQIKI